MSTAAPTRLEALRAEVRAIENAGGAAMARPCLPFGIEAVDRRLAGGGLACGVLHEAAGARPDLSDDAAATLFLAAAAARLAMELEAERTGPATVLWAMTARDLFAPGLALIGLRPENVLYAECRRDEEVQAVMEEALRHGGLAAVVGEVGRADMTATRRLQLAAEEGGTTALLLRRWRRAGVDPLAAPSSAVTRWRIAPAPSAPLPVPGIGRACWRVDLVRQRGGDPHQWLLEAPDAEARLALFSLPADRADPAGGEWQQAAA